MRSALFFLLWLELVFYINKRIVFEYILLYLGYNSGSTKTHFRYKCISMFRFPIQLTIIETTFPRHVLAFNRVVWLAHVLVAVTLVFLLLLHPIGVCAWVTFCARDYRHYATWEPDKSHQLTEREPGTTVATM